MRAQAYIIAILVSLLAWGTSLHTAQFIYRGAHESGLIPNLHIKNHVRHAIHRLT